jgi:hypothetical protein
MADQEVIRQLSQALCSFTVREWFAWAPSRDTRGAWRAWAGHERVEGDDASMPSLPMMLRRRVTPIGQKALGAALACDSVGHARYVLASRHGEFDRTVTILSSLAAQEQPSPAEFSMSVHHGLAGLLSIHTGNRLGHTAIAGSLDSFGYGLMEAAACLLEAPQIPILLIYFDDALPQSYAKFRLPAEAELPMALALTLAASESSGGVSISCHQSEGPEAAESLPLSFLRFLLSDTRSAAAKGGRMTWRWQRA